MCDHEMPFTTKSVLPVLPKPDHLVGSCQSRPLSAIEDKELRKKLRNRQSALAARERKKARMLELERKVAELQQTNRNLEEENSKLRQTLNAILRSATAPSVCGIFSNSSKSGRCFIAKTGKIDANDSQACGSQGKTLPPLEPGANSSRRKSTHYVPTQFKNKINYVISNQQSEEKEIPSQMFVSSTGNSYNPDMSPIDYSINAKSARKGNYVVATLKRKPIKIEGHEEVMGANAHGKRQHDILHSVLAGNLPIQNSPVASSTEYVTIKKEVEDAIFNCRNDEERQDLDLKSANGQDCVDQPVDENNSLFAQALKRSAHAMLLSSKQYTTNFGTSSQMNGHLAPIKVQCKRKQALPSIDAVFNSQSKVSRVSYVPNGETESATSLNQTKEKCYERIPDSATLNFTSQEEQPISLVKWPASNNKSKRDPYLHQNNDTSITKFSQDLSKSFAAMTETQIGLLPNDLSAIIDDYSNGPDVDDDDVLVGLYDSSAGNSPLESISSRDSGLGVDDDPLDWIPDTSFFDFH